MANKPYQRITFRGHTLNRRTVAAIQQAEDVLLKGIDLNILQGSYNGGRGSVSASAGTHDGGGAVDIAWPKDSRSEALKVQKALRQVGFAIWVRDDLPGVWHHHIHGILIGDKEMSAGALKQVQDYYHGLNGLAGHARDSSWRPNVIPVFGYPLAVVDVSDVRKLASAKRKTSGHPQVKVVQRALNAKTGTHLVTDGQWGPKTKAAYGRYEKQIGGDGDGLPAVFSLSHLGLARFTVKA